MYLKSLLWCWKREKQEGVSQPAYSAWQLVTIEIPYLKTRWMASEEPFLRLAYGAWAHTQAAGIQTFISAMC